MPAAASTASDPAKVPDTRFDGETRTPCRQITTATMLDDFQIDLRTRWIIAIASVIVAMPVFIIGLGVWVAYVNNWNFLNWME